MCFDRILARVQRPQRTFQAPNGRFRAVAPQRSVWINGSPIRITFLGGTKPQQDMVQRIARQWTDHANLSFEFTDDPRADIRVTFDPTDGAWSYIGTDNLGIPTNAATLNLGWLDQGVILHEFGHMIGLGHEHQNPEGGIEWNEAAVIADLQGPPNFWDEATIRFNVLERYSVDQIHGTKFDSKSIMLYAFPDEWTRNMGATQENTDLSEQDRAFVRSEKMYPGRKAPDESAVELRLGELTEGAIEVHEEEDLYRFEVGKAGLHVVETTGGTDVVLGVFGPDEPTLLVARDDDGGQGLNARIVARLEPGTYYAQVRHYWPDGIGEYRISAKAV
jgi:hypothetical protein